MKSLLISDNRDTQLGFRLAGIPGVIVHEKDDILRELNEALTDKEIGIIIVTQKVLEKAKKEIMGIKAKNKLPLVVVIPDRHGFNEGDDFITKHIRESIGIKI
ncbi:V-type ATP synthase subunit F [Caldisalinibacter kiritimatiensis]|uniref:V-type ATP synthase subunit F n=1 Tax=Caldisalinibacter kiritimatiensis TaxID=1304284 RepID=R1CXN1_9FIRM|nr:V-type ATP synthase subunit F [Caldisalinibacter kiritimatiensis]EOD01369.1 V-type ATP synthase subunit F [Caldisalinibacter kiritimatiensis]